jgi:hypothetical protein
MRLLTTLLLSMVSLLADTSDRLPNTRKSPLPFGASKRGGPRSAGKASKPVRARQKKGAIARSMGRAPVTARKNKPKTIRAPRRK